MPRWYSVLSKQRRGTEEISATVTVAADSPWFAGHFPENPILPGIAQVAMASDLVSMLRQEKMLVNGLNRVKFRKPVGPGEVLHIRVVNDTARNSFLFQITSDEQLVSSGALTFITTQAAL